MRCRPGDSIDMLPDDVLLQIFDFLVEEGRRRLSKVDVEVWQTLVHVCRRWRSLVFESPRRLDLRLLCTSKTPARYTLDVWPAFPLSIACEEIAENVDNIIAVLEHSDRVSYLRQFQRFGFGQTFGSDAGAIPRADIYGALVEG